MPRLHPHQLMLISFLTAIIVGAILLYLPFSHKGDLTFVDALFTSTSAVCVTGLIVVDTATFFTPIGKAIIAALIQAGGLGIVTFSVWILLLTGKDISFREKMVVEEAFYQEKFPNVKRLVKRVFKITFMVEGIGAFFLFLSFLKKGFPVLKAIGFSIFHSISAFCNAGFSLFSDSFMSYYNNTLVNVTIMLLIIIGGIGFIVIFDFIDYPKRKRLSLHSKVVLSMTFFLIMFGALFIFALEGKRAFSSFSLKEKILSSFFQAVTARTAGFNTVDLTALSPSTAFLLITLMFIGASPGSCGGGVKTSTLGILLLSVKSQVLGEPETFAFGRSISKENVGKALTVFVSSTATVFLCLFLLLNWGLPSCEKGLFLDALFESVSAFGTVGLSLGITPKLTAFGKIVTMLTMLAGRLGPITLVYALRREGSRARFSYPVERVMVG